jgi:hypothetical protein
MNARHSIQSSIAINQKRNGKVVENAMKIMNNALIERLKLRESEISELRTANDYLTHELELVETQKTTP